MKRHVRNVMRFYVVITEVMQCPKNILYVLFMISNLRILLHRRALIALLKRITYPTKFGKILCCIALENVVLTNDDTTTNNI